MISETTSYFSAEKKKVESLPIFCFEVQWSRALGYWDNVAKICEHRLAGWLRFSYARLRSPLLHAAKSAHLLVGNLCCNSSYTAVIERFCGR